MAGPVLERSLEGFFFFFLFFSFLFFRMPQDHRPAPVSVQFRRCKYIGGKHRIAA